MCQTPATSIGSPTGVPAQLALGNLAVRGRLLHAQRVGVRTLRDASHTMSDSPKVIDPVCGMTLHAHEAPFSLEHGDRVWYLCSIECRFKFDADRDAYIAASRLDLPGWGQTPHPESIVEQFRRPDA